MSDILTDARTQFWDDIIAAMPECGSRFYDVRTAETRLNWSQFAHAAQANSTVPYDLPYLVLRWDKAAADEGSIISAGYRQPVEMYYVTGLGDGVEAARTAIGLALNGFMTVARGSHAGKKYKVLSTGYEYDDTPDSDANLQALEADAQFYCGCLKVVLWIPGALSTQT